MASGTKREEDAYGAAQEELGKAYRSLSTLAKRRYHELHDAGARAKYDAASNRYEAAKKVVRAMDAELALIEAGFSAAAS